MHRIQALELLRAHARKSLTGPESAAVAEAIVFVNTHPDCLLRSCPPGHLTGSAWVVEPGRSRTLLTLHRKLNKWLNLGGHADGDPDLLAVALREAREESGLAGVRPVTPDLFDFDRHWIPEHKGDPGHWHYDFRFLLEADPKEPLRISPESKDLAWVGLDQVPALNADESMARLLRKTPRDAPGDS